MGDGDDTESIIQKSSIAHALFLTERALIFVFALSVHKVTTVRGSYLVLASLEVNSEEYLARWMYMRGQNKQLRTQDLTLE